VLLPITNRDDIRLHSCGAVMKRLMSVPCPAIFKVNNRDKVLDTLNREHKILPAKQVELMAGGLDSPPKPVIGKGF